jgi:glyoxylase-like metal-dependent hydrolase (beta-lactamase superfamily II)
MDCDASRQCAPSLLEIRDGRSVFVRQPRTDDEKKAAGRALLICPTASIGVEGDKPDLRGLFPQEIAEGIHLVGYASSRAYGSNAWFLERASGNVLVDGPRWVPSVAESLATRGGIAHVLLTHRDDVGDAQRYAERFGARVWIHEAERGAAPFATDLFRSTSPTTITEGLLAIPVPGHTRGSVAFLLEDRALFSGDSVHFSRGLGKLAAFGAQCWYSWPEQTRSIERLAQTTRFTHLFPGHGSRWVAPSAEAMREALLDLARRMDADDPALRGTPW